MLNIVFGSSKVGRSTTGVQEFTVPSIKLEASRGAGTSRRILFNKAADKRAIRNWSCSRITFRICIR